MSHAIPKLIILLAFFISPISAFAQVGNLQFSEPLPVSGSVRNIPVFGTPSLQLGAIMVSADQLSSDFCLSEFSTWMIKNGTPTDAIIVQARSGGSTPEESTILGISIPKNGATLSTSTTEEIFTFTNCVNVRADQNLWFLFVRQNLDTTNTYSITSRGTPTTGTPVQRWGGSPFQNLDQGHTELWGIISPETPGNPLNPTSKYIFRSPSQGTVYQYIRSTTNGVCGETAVVNGSAHFLFNPDHDLIAQQFIARVEKPANSSLQPIPGLMICDTSNNILYYEPGTAVTTAYLNYSGFFWSIPGLELNEGEDYIFTIDNRPESPSQSILWWWPSSQANYSWEFSPYGVFGPAVLDLNTETEGYWPVVSLLGQINLTQEEEGLIPPVGGWEYLDYDFLTGNEGVDAVIQAVIPKSESLNWELNNLVSHLTSSMQPVTSFFLGFYNLLFFEQEDPVLWYGYIDIAPILRDSTNGWRDITTYFLYISSLFSLLVIAFNKK